jgi:hypothetical protein
VTTGSTDLVTLRGTFDLTVQNEGQEVSGQGKFLCTAAKHGGEWLVSAACFNLGRTADWMIPFGQIVAQLSGRQKRSN